MCHTFCGWNPTIWQFKWELIKRTVVWKKEKKNGSTFWGYRYILIKEKRVTKWSYLAVFFPCVQKATIHLLVHPEKRLKHEAKEIGGVWTQASVYYAVYGVNLAFTGCEWMSFLFAKEPGNFRAPDAFRWPLHSVKTSVCKDHRGKIKRPDPQ